MFGSESLQEDSFWHRQETPSVGVQELAAQLTDLQNRLVLAHKQEVALLQDENSRLREELFSVGAGGWRPAPPPSLACTPEGYQSSDAPEAVRGPHTTHDALACTAEGNRSSDAPGPAEGARGPQALGAGVGRLPPPVRPELQLEAAEGPMPPQVAPLRASSGSPSSASEHLPISPSSYHNGGRHACLPYGGAGSMSSGRLEPLRAAISRKSTRNAPARAHEFELCKVWIEGAAVVQEVQERDAFPVGSQSTDRSDPFRFSEMEGAAAGGRLKSPSFIAEKLKLGHGIKDSFTVDIKPRRCENCPLEPHSLQRLSWDAFGMALICFDSVVLPLQAFTPADVGFDAVFQWIARCFWTIDIPMSFFTGYFRQDGEAEMKVKAVAWHYATTWLLFDFALVLLGYLELVLDAEADNLSTTRLGRIARVLRILRIARLARLFKLPRVMDAITERILSEGVILVMGIIQSTVCILCGAHFLACTWYGIAWDEDRTHVGTWIESAGYSEARFGSQYVLALQWAVAQLTQNTAVVDAHTVLERLYELCILFFGFLVSSFFISGITTSMTRLQLMRSRQQLQFSRMRRYLRNHKVQTRLAVLINREVKRTVALRQQNVLETDVELLDILSEPLKIELHFEVHGRVLWAHPLLRSMCIKNGEAMRQVCHAAVSVLFVSRGDLLFRMGERPKNPRMLVVMGGVLEYARPKRPPEEVRSPDWVSEMVLWCNWMHRGRLRAKTECTVLALFADSFQKVISSYYEDSDYWMHPARYAEAFVSKLNELNEEDLTDLDQELCHRTCEEARESRKRRIGLAFYPGIL